MLRWLPLERPAHARDVDAVEQHRQLRAVELRGHGITIEVGHQKPARFEAFVEDDEAAIVPAQNFHAVTAARDEDEQRAGVDVLLPAIHHDGDQPIDAVAHVDWVHREHDSNGAR